ncbi:pro-sigmaK processing inhibitor BofA family protein [Lederbergia graminis]|uniref:Pro-sigmaK processing inhibitor BofA family protein n=1 Tax=Lederbergia graminis TaxID=735518 RepID=A0ABW0LGN0_9BACI|nr:pro-sigmaK processing inhibitor BofA family protein [Paenibacillus bovis]HLU23306.1 pro-sigmaK processing inhibitor BofA family protein [Bacillaceae bacterium]
MKPALIISIISGIIILLLIVGIPGKTFKWIGQAFMKLMIGAMFLFFLNVIGNQFGISVPINLITTTISGFLGIPGVAALTVIQLWIV